MQKKLNYLFLFLLLSLFAGCTFIVEDDRAFTMTRIGNTADTVSIWPQLAFCFSVPLAKDSSVHLIITPDPGPVYSVYLNRNRDTVRLDVSQSLEGNTTYFITLQDTLQSVNDKYLYPADVSFSFTTYPKENEPNNTSATADTLRALCFGASVTATDTDFYFIPATNARGIYLKSMQSKSGCIVLHITGAVLKKNNTLDQTKTIAFNDTINAPCYMAVYPLFDNATRYELGMVQ
jgi:hypothetical protein